MGPKRKYHGDRTRRERGDGSNPSLVELVEDSLCLCHAIAMRSSPQMRHVHSDQDGQKMKDGGSRQLVVNSDLRRHVGILVVWRHVATTLPNQVQPTIQLDRRRWVDPICQFFHFFVKGIQ